MDQRLEWCIHKPRNSKGCHLPQKLRERCRTDYLLQISQSLLINGFQMSNFQKYERIHRNVFFNVFFKEMHFVVLCYNRPKRLIYPSNVTILFLFYSGNVCIYTHIFINVWFMISPFIANSFLFEICTSLSIQ